MIPLNYHHLYYFWVVARSGSISAARQRLYLSQPALSGQLAQLEKSCGARLFERSRKGMSLTFEGKAVFEKCERIFSEGEELAALIRGGFQSPAILRLGVQPAVSREVVLRLLDFCSQTEPSARVAVNSGELSNLEAKLKQGTIDFLVANEDAAAGLGEGFASRLVARLPVYFAANREVRRLVRRFPQDLSNTAMLMRPPDNPVRKQADLFLSRRRVSVRVEADSDDVGLLRRLAVKGRGVAALSALALEDDLKEGRLVLLHRTPVEIHEPIWFSAAASPRANPALRKLIDELMGRFGVFGRAPKVRSYLA